MFFLDRSYQCAQPCWLNKLWYDHSSLQLMTVFTWSIYINSLPLFCHMHDTHTHTHNPPENGGGRFGAQVSVKMMVQRESRCRDEPNYCKEPLAGVSARLRGLPSSFCRLPSLDSSWPLPSVSHTYHSRSTSLSARGGGQRRKRRRRRRDGVRDPEGLSV